ncbi:aminopeptidase [Candidatus Sumerlaeota bacterium]|nr:aminopeptidase [Candidatus Sumerlaeota bacterium]
MIDPRDKELAQILVSYATKAHEGDLVFVECIGADTLGLGQAVVEAAVAAGAAPHLQYAESALTRRIINNASDAVFERMAQFQLKQMQDATVYIGIRGTGNAFEMNGVNPERLKVYSRIVATPVHMNERVKNTRWCILRYPNPAMAQMAGKSTEDFAKFYYDVCCLDYPFMDKACVPLKEIMTRTNTVRIKGPGKTDVSFSISGIPAIPCTGNMNIPDGECFTAPVRDSINGCVQFNTPTMHEGQAFSNITLQFKDGKVVQAQDEDASKTAALNKVLDVDPGARFVGEFSLAFNPFIFDPIGDILFDEKICGSFHMALGKCYDEAPNGNKSTIHWDLVCVQRPEFGGGEIWFDDKLIRKDGIFIIDELKGLNPDNYKRNNAE